MDELRAGTVSQPQAIHAVFEIQAAKKPDAVALAFEGTQVTFDCLNRRANRLAHYLMTQGVDHEVPVAVCVGRGQQMWIATLAVLKAGGAYVPLDAAHPPARLNFMIGDARARLLISESGLANRPEWGNTCLLDQVWDDLAPYPSANPGRPVHATQAAYVIYTSGSTGHPKGVWGSHGAALNRFRWMWRAYPFAAGEVVCQKTTLGFVDAVWEMFGGLLAGMRTIAVPQAVLSEMPVLVACLIAHRVTRLVLVPSLLRAMIQSTPAAGHLLDTVSYWTLSGEPLAQLEGEPFLARMREKNLLNLYGSTEVSADATAQRILADTPLNTIGRAIDGNEVLLLDHRLFPVPAGVAGEVYIKGAGLARGYIHQPGLTALRFLPEAAAAVPGGRMYRTGDLAHRGAGGQLVYMGRTDHQVKIRGIRIELDEVSHALQQHPGVVEAAVIVRGSQAGEKSLAAFVVEDRSWQKAPELNEKQVSDWDAVWSHEYEETSADIDPRFNFVGWQSSYSVKEIPQEAGVAWAEEACARILKLKPRDVLEIGVGSGMYLFRLGKYCRKYWGTDLSQAGIEYVKRMVPAMDTGDCRIALFASPAEDLSMLENQRFDAVVINSVVQYFPSINYLFEVLSGALEALTPHGAVFIGDVRSLPLLELFHNSVLVDTSAPDAPAANLMQRTRQRMLQEKELVIDPGFFLALQAYFPQVQHVQIMPKQSPFNTEFTMFRYDVVLHTAPVPCKKLALAWEEWPQTAGSFAQLANRLKTEDPAELGILGVPNGRLQAHNRGFALSTSPGDLQTCGAVKAAVAECEIDGALVTDFEALARETGYSVELTYLGSGPEGSYGLILRGPEVPERWIEYPVAIPADFNWSNYANNPLQGKAAVVLVPELRRFLNERLPAAMVPGTIAVREALPRTATGKVDRNVLANEPEAGVRRAAYQAPRTPVETLLVEVWGDILGVKQLGIGDDFFQLGGHSLMATQVVSQLRKRLRIQLQVGHILQFPTIAQLGGQIDEMLSSGKTADVAAIVRVDRQQPIPLSYGQEGLFVTWQVAPKSPIYNISHVLRLEGELNTAAMTQAVRQLIERHEILHTGFQMQKGRPLQAIHPPEQVSLTWVEVGGEDGEKDLEAAVNAEILKPFDLLAGPPVRVKLYRLDGKTWVQQWVMHHILCDGWSMDLLIGELLALYEAICAGRSADLAPVPFQYADFSAWQRQNLQGEALNSLLDYWENQLRGAETLALPTDFARPAVQRFNLETQTFVLDSRLSADLRAFSNRNGVTLFMTLLAAYHLQLALYTGQRDISVGTTVANRNRAETDYLVGFLANLLVLRMTWEGDPGFGEFLEAVKHTTLAAYQHADAPFYQVVERLHPPRDPSRSPLFQVNFVLHNTVGSTRQLLYDGGKAGNAASPSLEVVSQGFEYKVAQFDLTVHMIDAGEALHGVLVYNQDLFQPETVRRFGQQFSGLLAQIAAQPEKKLSQYSLLTSADEQLLAQWRQAAGKHGDRVSIHGAFEAQAAQQPAAEALRQGDEVFTYEQLNQRANQLARTLRDRGVGADTAVGICAERSPAQIVAILAILKAGAAYVPLDPNYPEERLSHMIEDAGMGFLMGNEGPMSRLPAGPLMFIETLDLADASLYAAHATANLDVPACGLNLAYIMYTSGSTGLPKGVMVSHQNVVRVTLDTNYVTIGPDDRVLQAAPISFDASTFEIWAALLNGGCLVQPQANLPGADSLSRIIEDQQISTMWLTAALFDAMAVHRPQTFTHVRQLLAGGDVLSPTHVKRVRNIMKQGTVINGYGPTETTTFAATYATAGHRMETRSVPIGRPVPDTELHVLGPGFNPLPPGVTGELFIGGRGLARGYRNAPAATALKFMPNPFASGESMGSRVYRTGDLVRWLPEGVLDFTGRADSQLKIRGYRIEPGEIESALLQHAQVETTHVMAWQEPDSDGGKRLTAYWTCAGGEIPAAAELRSFLKDRLPDYMVPAHFVRLEALPVTANGKVDRHALPDPRGMAETSAAVYEAPRTEKEKLLAAIWQEVLGISQVGIRDRYYDLGGDSLLAIQVAARTQEAGYDFELPFLLGSPDIAALAEVLVDAGERQQVVPFSMISEADRALLPDGVEDAYPMSNLQQGMLFHSGYETRSTVYHDVITYRLRLPLNEAVIRQILDDLTRRHDVLRTAFDLTSYSRPLQLVWETAAIPLEIEDLRSRPVEDQQQYLTQWLQKEAPHGFDWSVRPLLRLYVFQLGASECEFAFSLHHAILDGWSLASLVTEIIKDYQALLQGRSAMTTAPQARYRDYIALERAAVESEEDREFWQRSLAGHTVTRLPRDLNPHEVLEGDLGHVPIDLPEEVASGFQGLALRTGVPLKTVLLAAHLKALSVASGRGDVTTGMVTNGRPEVSGGDRVLGLFLNSIPLRLVMQPNESWLDLIGRVFQAEQDCLPHRRFPLPEIMRLGGGRRLFEVLFNYTNFHIYSELGEKSFGDILNQGGYEKTSLPMMVDFSPTGAFDFSGKEGVRGLLSYYRSVFSPGKAREIAHYYENVLTAMIQNPEGCHAVGNFLPPQSIAQLTRWNQTAAPVPGHTGIHQLFERQVTKTPQATAVMDGSLRISYQDLNYRATALARALRVRGAGPGSRVGLCTDRSVAVLTGALAILKTGAAYVPLDPNYPRERLDFMLRDAGAALMVSQERCLPYLPPFDGEILCLGRDEALFEAAAAPLPDVVHPAQLAYLIYTSGSTGRPKGVAMTHGSAVTMLTWGATAFSPEQLAGTMACTSVCFDLSVFELFLPLTCGGAVILADDALQLPNLPAVEEVTLINTVPSAMDALVRDEALPASVKTVNLAGEALERGLVDRIYALAGVEAVYNLYGPSEDTTYSTYALVPRGEPSKPLIGKPIHNTQAHILDYAMQPVPIGVPGNLYLSGAGLARGYLARPALTAASFIPNPLSQESGGRLYHTGDLARYREGGELEFLGRGDYQVKVRGFRIELGEIEAALAKHAAVSESAVIVREHMGMKRIEAYVVNDPEYQTHDQLAQEQVTSWEGLWADTYEQFAESQPPLTNFKGWNSSYTNQPLPEAEMLAWAADAEARILAAKPRRILEIGCGSGLFLFRLAPHTEAYVGTDFSGEALAYVKYHLPKLGEKAANVTLHRCWADDFSGLDGVTVDTVVINSVVQYFPGIDYLLRVIEASLRIISGKGQIFIGDVRNYDLLEAFHSSIVLNRAEGDTPLEQMRAGVQQQTVQENELLIAPAFFHALQAAYPAIKRVDIMPKRGNYLNELSKFRYDVFLHLDEGPPAAAGTPEAEWSALDLTALNTVLNQHRQVGLNVHGIPDERVTADLAAAGYLAEGTLKDAAALCSAVTQQTGMAPSQKALQQLAGEHQCQLELVLEGEGSGLFSAVFTPHGQPVVLPARPGARRASWADYANDPLRGQIARVLVPELRTHLLNSLPEYMVPSAFVFLDSIPLTLNGKLDRKALPLPAFADNQIHGFVAPRNPEEEMMATLWASTLGVDRVGIHDNFFELGGNSLHANQCLSMLRRQYKVDFETRLLFENPVLEDFSYGVLKIVLAEGMFEGDLDELVNRLTNEQVQDLMRFLEEGG